MTLKRFLRTCFIGTFLGIFLTSIILFIIGRRTTFVNVSLIIGSLILLIYVCRYIYYRIDCKNMIKKYSEAYETIKSMHALRYKCYLGGQQKEIKRLNKLIEEHCYDLIKAGNILKGYRYITKGDIEEFERISEKIENLMNTIIPPSA